MRILERQHFRVADIDGDDQVGPERRGLYGKVVDHTSVDADPVSDFARRKEPGQRARSVDRILDVHVLESRRTENDLRGALEIHCIHEEGRLQFGEGAPWNDGFNESSEWRLEIDRG